MKNINYITKKVTNELSINGYSIVNNVLNNKSCNRIIKNLEKIQKKTLKNKNFIQELSQYGQIVIRDLVLRDPKNFLKLLDKNIIVKVIDNIFKDTFILDNCMASNSKNVKKHYYGLVHIDSHLPCKSYKNTSDIVVLYCLDEFTKKNGATKIWPKSHLSGIRIQDDKKYSTRIKKKYKYVEAKKGSIVFFLGQTWHQIGKNTNFKSRWGVLCHYKRWWIKPSTDFTKCGPAIYKLLNRKQKELFGFNSISPKFNLKKQTKVLKILRSTDKLSSKYSKAIRY